MVAALGDLTSRARAGAAHGGAWRLSVQEHVPLSCSQDGALFDKLAETTSASSSESARKREHPAASSVCATAEPKAQCACQSRRHLGFLLGIHLTGGQV